MIGECFVQFCRSCVLWCYLHSTSLC